MRRNHPLLSGWQPPRSGAAASPPLVVLLAPLLLVFLKVCMRLGAPIRVRRAFDCTPQVILREAETDPAERATGMHRTCNQPEFNLHPTCIQLATKCQRGVSQWALLSLIGTD